MSYTEIFKFTKSGRAGYFAETKNSHRGAWAVWRTIEDRYLPPLYLPFNGLDGEPLRNWRINSFDDGVADVVWALAWDIKVPEVDRICLMSTFDKVVVNRENIERLLAAFRTFDGETSLPEQADEIGKLYKKDKNFLAIAWNQTSVNADHWGNYNRETGQSKAYNIVSGEYHFELFIEIDKINEQQKTNA